MPREFPTVLVDQCTSYFGRHEGKGDYKMNKLKAYTASNMEGRGLTDYYLKSEADKVIAELKAREDVLVTDNRNLLYKVKVLENQLRETAEHYKRNESKILENAEKEIRHHKYKRCLAMVEMCREMATHYNAEYNAEEGFGDGWLKWIRWAKKWANKWLAIAEKFKEAR